MTSVFNPARGAHETFDSYQGRRIAAKKIISKMRLTGPFSPGKNTSREERRQSMRDSGAMSKRRRFADSLMRSWAGRRRNEAAYLDALVKFHIR